MKHYVLLRDLASGQLECNPPLTKSQGSVARCIQVAPRGIPFPMLPPSSVWLYQESMPICFHSRYGLGLWCRRNTAFAAFPSINSCHHDLSCTPSHHTSVSAA